MSHAHCIPSKITLQCNIQGVSTEMENNNEILKFAPKENLDLFFCQIEVQTFTNFFILFDNIFTKFMSKTC